MFTGLLILFAAALVLLLLLASLATARTLTHPPRRTPGYAIAHNQPTDPAEAGAPYTTHNLTADEGKPIELWIVEGAAPTGPTLILIHGWADSRLGSLLWFDLLRPLAAQLVLFDLRAHGDSPHKRFTWGDRETGDIRRIVEHAAATAPDSPIILAGRSIGASLAVTAAQQLGPTRVAAVLADSPCRTPHTAVANTLRAQGLPAEPLTTLALKLLRWRGIRSLNNDLIETTATLEQPLLIIHCNNDPIVPLTDAQAITATAPDAQLHTFDSDEHIAAARIDPILYQQTIHDWLRTSTRSRQSQ